MSDLDLWPIERDPLARAWSGALSRRAAAEVDTSRAHVEYQRRPVDWIVEKLGIPEHTVRWSLNEGYDLHTWDGNVDPIVHILEALAAGKDVGVESATGTGKTFIGACIVLWFLACWEDSIVVTAAPKEDQLLLHIWKEIGQHFPAFRRHFPQAELLTGKLRMRPAAGDKESWAATAFVCGVGAAEQSATKAQGFHAEHMLIITEETPGIHSAVMTAFENTRTDDHNLHLAFGNPDHQHDALHEFCARPEVEAVRISALDHPNIVTGRSVVPGAIGRKRLESRKARYGEGNRLWLSRGRGISPKESAEALIRWDWLVQASKRYDDEPTRARLARGAPAIGGDVANSETGDKGAISRWLGSVCVEVVDFRCPDANEMGARVAVEMRAGKVDQYHVGIDSVGVGAGAVNKLKELELYVRALNGGAKAEVAGADDARGDEEEVFNNLRSQMWWQARLDLQHGEIATPEDEELFRDLTAPTWTTRGGKIVVESKEEFTKRLGRSPNKGDAFVYGNWVRKRIPEPELPPLPPADERVHDRVRALLAEAAKRAEGDDLTLDEAPVEMVGEGWEGLYS